MENFNPNPQETNKINSRREFLKNIGLYGGSLFVGGTIGKLGIDNVADVYEKYQSSQKNIESETRELLEKCFEQYKSIFLKSNPEIQNSESTIKCLQERFDSIANKYPIVFDTNRDTYFNAELIPFHKQGAPDTVVVRKRLLGFQNFIKNNLDDRDVIEDSYNHHGNVSVMTFKLLIAEISHRAYQTINPQHFNKISEEYKKHSEEQRYTNPDLQEYITHEVVEPAIFAFLFQKLNSASTEISLDECIDNCLSLYTEVMNDIPDDDASFKGMDVGIRQKIINDLISEENITLEDITYLKNIVCEVGIYMKSKNDNSYEPASMLFAQYGEMVSKLIGKKELVLLDAEIHNVYLRFLSSFSNEGNYIYIPEQNFFPTEISESIYKIMKLKDWESIDEYNIVNHMFKVRFSTEAINEILKIIELCIEDTNNNTFDKSKIPEIITFLKKL